MTKVFVITDALYDNVLAVFSTAEGAAAEVERIVAEDVEPSARQWWESFGPEGSAVRTRRRGECTWEEHLAQQQAAVWENLYVVEFELDAKTDRS